MNELIKELAEQAKQYALDAMIKIADKGQALMVYSETYDTKLVELIVKECVEIASDVGTDTVPTDFALDKCYEIESKIKKHFGVEE